MLSPQAMCSIEEWLWRAVERVAGHAWLRMLAEIIGSENPFAASNPHMLTNEQKGRAARVFAKRIEAGDMALPKPLTETLSSHLRDLADATVEMLRCMADYQDEICEELFEGKVYTLIEDVELSVGDFHNHGRSVAIVATDVGRLVYKPRDLRGDVEFSCFVKRFFPDIVEVPQAVALSEDFGVCEFFVARRPQGLREAAAYYRSLGGVTALFSMLGSSDMHVCNLAADGERIVLLDLETPFSPIPARRRERQLNPAAFETILGSAYPTCILPSAIGITPQPSILINTEDDGWAPEVDGRRVNVYGYLDVFFAGHHEVMDRMRVQRQQIGEALRALGPLMTHRLIIKDTRDYVDLQTKLWKSSALLSPESYERAREALRAITCDKSRLRIPEVALEEANQLERGDIPHFYSRGDGLDLYSDGRLVVKNCFEMSGCERALKNLATLDAEREKLNCTIIGRSLAQYAYFDEEDTIGRSPEPVEGVMDPELALHEALGLCKEVLELHFLLLGGHPTWGMRNPEDGSFHFADYSLSDGLLGISLFLSECAMCCKRPDLLNAAETAVDEALLLIRIVCETLENHSWSFEFSPTLGEGNGVGGILVGLALLRRCLDRKDVRDAQNLVLSTAEHLDYPRYGVADRLTGMAGLLSALCRFEEYHHRHDLMRMLADRMLEVRSLPWNGRLLWQTMAHVKRPLSGAGHGHMGIAEALFAASDVLEYDTRRYLAAAQEAVQFELQTYSERLGTWPDRRATSPKAIMHGYCSGAPGIGIMLERIRSKGIWDDALETCASRAKESVARLPYNIRDHLCCGNSAIVEYCVSTGQMNLAGKLLLAMQNRSRQQGAYCYVSTPLHNTPTASLLFGISGIGHELLRYAFPDKVFSVL